MSSRQLSKKILCSILTAGVLSIGGVQCVWAAEGDYAGHGIAVTDGSLTDYSGKKVIGGWDIYNGNPIDGGSAETNTSITISSGIFDDIIGGSHIKQPVKDYTDKNFTVNIGNTDINITGGEFTGAVIGGSKANNSDKTILNVGNINVDISNGTFAGIIVGGNNIKSTGNPGGGTPAENTATAGDVKVNISGGTFGNTVYGGSVADNYGTAQAADGKPVLKATDNSTELTITGGTFNGNDLFAGGAAIGTDSEYTTENASVIVKDANVEANIYGGAYADKGTATVTNANVQIDNSTVNGSVYAGGKAENNGTSSVGSSTVNINNSTINGIVYLESTSQNLNASNIKVTDAVKLADSSYYKGIGLSSGATAHFTGDYTDISIDSESTGSVVGIQVHDGSATFSTSETNIDVRAVGSSGNWGFGLLVNGANGGHVVFDGGNVNISNYNEKYTSQTLTAKAGSTIDFNNTGDITIKAESPYGVTAVDANGDITFNNTGNVDIIGTIVPGDKTAKTNVVGIQSGTKGTEINVTNKVKDFNITLSGAGVDSEEGSTYSSGTSAVYLWDDITANINSETFNIDMKVDPSVTPDAPTGHTTDVAYGLQPDGGVINVGENTYTSITIDEGLGTGYAIYSEGSTSEVNVLGNTDINVTGKTGAYALYAVDGGTITVGSEGKTVSLVGDVVADGKNSVINIAGNSVFNGNDTEFTSTNNGIINLAGGNMSGVLNISKDSTVNLNGATFTTNDIASDITGDGKLVLKDSGVLSTTADQIFISESGNVTATDKVNGILGSTAEKVTFESGTVSLTDAEYNLDFLHSAVAAMGSYKYDNTNTSKTGIVMTGDLVGGIEDNKISVEDAASVGDDIALDKVTVEADNNLLVGAVVDDNTEVESITIHDSVTNGFNAGSLNLAEGSTGMVITNDKNVTLGGSEGGSIITVNGAEPTGDGVKVVVGLDNSNVAGVTNEKGSFTIGNALATSETEYTLNGSVTVNNGSNLTTNGQTTITGKVTLNNGNLDAASGALDLTGANSGITATGNSTITGTVNVGTLTGGNGAVINVGTAEKTASTSIKDANLNGATICFDPDWDQEAGTHGIAFIDENGDTADVDGKVLVGRNNYVGVGTADSQAAKEMFAKTGLTFGEDDITAALYIAGNQTLDGANGAIVVDGNSETVSDSGVTGGTFKAADNSVTMVDGQSIKDTAALSGVTAATIDSDAKLYIDNAKKGETYKVINGADTGWKDGNIISDNSLLVFAGDKNDDSAFNVTASYDKVDNVYGEGAVVIADVVDKTLADEDEGNAAFDFFNAAASSKNNATKDAQVAAFNSAANMGEMGGVNHAAYSVSNAMTDAVADHLSIATNGDQDKDIWAHYVHNKENIEGISLGGINADYDLQYNGIVVGSDLYKKGKATAGIALSYIEGDVTNSNIASNTKNEAEYYGASVYGRIDNGNSAVLGDITYMHGSSDITQQNSGYKLTADADTDVFSIGVRAEQKVEAGVGQFVPYAGLRYMHIGTGNYTNSIGMSYDVDEQNLWLLPVGVTYSCEAQKGDWTIRPVVEAGYVWAMGDRDTNQIVSLNGAADGFGFDTADSGSFISRFAVEAEKANVVYSLGYEYQKGDTVKANKWMANMTFTF